MTDIAAALGRVVGHEVVYEQIPEEEWGSAPSSALAMNAWYQQYGYDEDIPALKAKWGIPTLTFQWLTPYPGDSSHPSSNGSAR